MAGEVVGLRKIDGDPIVQPERGQILARDEPDGFGVSAGDERDEDGLVKAFFLTHERFDEIFQRRVHQFDKGGARENFF